MNMATKPDEVSAPVLSLDWLTDALRMRHNRDRRYGCVDEEIGALMRILMGEDFDTTTVDVVNVITQKDSWTAILLDELDRIVGMCSLLVRQNMHGRRGLIEDLVLLPEYEGYGYGERLMQVLLTKARQERATYIELMCERRRHNARKLYTRLGFTNLYGSIFRIAL